MVRLDTSNHLAAFREGCTKELRTTLAWNKKFGQKYGIDAEKEIERMKNVRKPIETKKEEFEDDSSDDERYDDYISDKKIISGHVGRFVGFYCPDYEEHYKTSSKACHKKIDFDEDHCDRRYCKEKYPLKTFFEERAKAYNLEKKKEQK